VTPARVTPGQPLSPQQQTGLALVARLYGGRDVVLAIDLTESVGLNDEGRLRLRQIVQDSLQAGDSVYVVPFAATVNPLSPNVNPIDSQQALAFSGQKADLDRILAAIPFQPDLDLRQTDIELAELTIYRGLAQLNQDRLQQNRPIKSQSVVWVTDAPLFSNSGADWTETPAQSPFRIADSPLSQERQAWLQSLPLREKSLTIPGNGQRDYKLAVVDVLPTVQEFCTPAPGGQETCLVNPYLFKQLWPLGAGLMVVAIACGFGIAKLLKLRKKWQIVVDFESTEKDEEQICYLPNHQRIAIGEYESSCVDAIDCPGAEVRAYLERQGQRLYLVPTHLAPIYCNGREIEKRTPISSSLVRINCPNANHRDFEFSIQVKK
jgi:hypothetical protein